MLGFSPKGDGPTTNPKAAKVGLGPRIAEWLRLRFPTGTRKAVASEFGVSIGLAKMWLRGQCPATWHLEDMAARWGKGFVLHAFQDACHMAEEWHLRRRAAALENQHKAQSDALASEKASGRVGVASLGRAVAKASRASVRGLIGRIRHKEAA